MFRSRSRPGDRLFLSGSDFPGIPPPLILPAHFLLVDGTEQVSCFLFPAVPAATEECDRWPLPAQDFRSPDVPPALS